MGQLYREKKKIKINCKTNFISFFIYLFNFLSNKIHLNKHVLINFLIKKNIKKPTRLSLFKELRKVNAINAHDATHAFYTF